MAPAPPGRAIGEDPKDPFGSSPMARYIKINRIIYAQRIYIRHKNGYNKKAIIRKGVATMAAKTDTSMTIRMNREIKQEAQDIFAALGMDMTTAINVFLRQAIRRKGFPFDVRLDEPNAVTYAAIEAVEKDEDVYGPFDSVADLMEALNA